MSLSTQSLSYKSTVLGVFAEIIEGDGGSALLGFFAESFREDGGSAILGDDGRSPFDSLSLSTQSLSYKSTVLGVFAEIIEGDGGSALLGFFAESFREDGGSAILGFLAVSFGDDGRSAFDSLSLSTQSLSYKSIVLGVFAESFEGGCSS